MVAFSELLQGGFTSIGGDHAIKVVLKDDDWPMGVICAHLGRSGEVHAGLVAWEPYGPLKPIFSLKCLFPLSLEPHVVCQQCHEKGWITNGAWVPISTESEFSDD